MRRPALLATLSLPLLFAAEAWAKPCITNLNPSQGGISLNTFKSHSAKLGGQTGKPE